MINVLIVEDHLMIADMVEELLLKSGYNVCGIARTVAEGVALGLLHKPDLALIDLHLADDGMGTEVAARLSCLNKLGILYVTGNLSHVALTSEDGAASLEKPYRASDLLKGLRIVTSLAHGEKAPKVFPRGFRVLPPAAMTGEIGHG